MNDHSQVGHLRGASSPGRIYDETVFHHFLDVERARAARGRRPVRLLLVSLTSSGRPESGHTPPIPPAVTQRLFDGLWHVVRETDMVGWYRDGHIAGVILADGRGAALAGSPDTAAAIETRVTRGLAKRLPSSLATKLSVRIVELGPRGQRH